MMYREIKDIFRVKKNNEIYGKDQFFSKKIKILLLECIIKIVYIWKTVMIIPVYRY